jgi:hypothetical protein
MAYINCWTISTNMAELFENETKAADHMKHILCTEMFCTASNFWDTRQNKTWEYKAL